ncbi:hypothetical protein BZL30_1378 [Mycobacterium kansasii]|uniref:Uncharacterized protein n=1 Tax=Mycobacterium kansasii TaxID=1768 RepID=A0A1V3XRS8_MYCKA|nr:hypothetical protein BZL30_1378 [Mycobacterium kansasii]OOK83484.1 hypothetical protein BZL29_0576 [Mycobacterium kansasii]
MPDGNTFGNFRKANGNRLLDGPAPVKRRQNWISRTEGTYVGCP